MSEAVVVNQPLKKRKKESMFKQVCGRLVKNPTAMLGVAILAVIVLASAFAPLLAPYDPNAMDYTALKAGPSAQHLLGCDQLGRDLLSRILYGGRYSLALGNWYRYRNHRYRAGFRRNRSRCNRTLPPASGHCSCRR